MPQLKEIAIKFKVWQGAAPAACDICGHPLREGFVDGKTQLGPWGIMCEDCYARHGVGLGTGRGQQYAQHKSGSWVKIAG